MRRVKAIVAVTVMGLLLPAAVRADIETNEAREARAQQILDGFVDSQAKDDRIKKAADSLKDLNKKLNYAADEMARKEKIQSLAEKNRGKQTIIDKVNDSVKDLFTSRAAKREQLNDALSEVEQPKSSVDGSTIDAAGEAQECKTRLSEVNLKDLRKGIDYVTSEMEKMNEESPEEKRDRVEAIAKHIANLKKGVLERAKKKQGLDDTSTVDSTLGALASGKHDAESRKKRQEEDYDRLQDEGTKLELALFDALLDAAGKKDKLDKKEKKEKQNGKKIGGIFGEVAEKWRKLVVPESKRIVNACKRNIEAMDGDGEESLRVQIYKGIKELQSGQASRRDVKLDANRWWFASGKEVNELKCKDTTAQATAPITQFEGDAANLKQGGASLDMIQRVSNMSSRVGSDLANIVKVMEESVKTCNAAAALKKKFQKKRDQIVAQLSSDGQAEGGVASMPNRSKSRSPGQPAQMVSSGNRNNGFSAH